jgi:uncharacterized protein YdbL (DUF1318 family)
MYKQFSKGEGGKTSGGKSEHLNTKASLADIATEMENDWSESVRKLAQAHDVSTYTVHDTLHKDLQL